MPLEEIIYFEITEGHKINVITPRQNYCFFGKLKDVRTKLEQADFLWIHHSFLVNYAHIHRISYEEVTLSNHITLLISGPKRKEVRRKYAQLRKERSCLI
jgi:DNA-binding LytR/AlgR family response regulator